MRIRPNFLFAPVLAFLLGACALPQEPTATTPPPQPTFPLSLTDDAGVTVELEAAPERVVAWSPALNEVLAALGVESVVGGSGIRPTLEKFTTLRADLVLDDGDGPEQWKDDLRARGVPVVTVVTATVDDLLHDIQTVGRVAGAPKEADELVGEMAKAIAAIEKRSGEAGPVTCFLRSAPAGESIEPGSFVQDVLTTAGCDPVDRAAKAKRVLEIDWALISRPSPRIVDGLEALAEALYP
jgi:iron complex transport system substrate-binding protein